MSEAQNPVVTGEIVENSKVIIEGKSVVEYEYVGTISEHLKCPVCGEPFVDPTRGPCGHTFCKLCIEGWLQRSPSCPSDRKPMKIDQLQKDFIAANLVDELQVVCPFDCKFTCQRQQMTKHLLIDCQEAAITCVHQGFGCKFGGKRKDLSKHLQQCSFEQIKEVLKLITSQAEEIKKLRAEVEELKEVKKEIAQIRASVDHSKPTFKDITVEIGNTHEMIGPGNHSWCFFVRGANGASLEGIVDKVLLQLHETFPQPNVTLSSHPFTLKGKAWGTFEIKIQIHANDGRVISLAKELSFAGKLIYTTFLISGNSIAPVRHNAQ